MSDTENAKRRGEQAKGVPDPGRAVTEEILERGLPADQRREGIAEEKPPRRPGRKRAPKLSGTAG
jgi:hypothetical protein